MACMIHKYHTEWIGNVCDDATGPLNSQSHMYSREISYNFSPLIMHLHKLAHTFLSLSVHTSGMQGPQNEVND